MVAVGTGHGRRTLLLAALMILGACTQSPQSPVRNLQEAARGWDCVLITIDTLRWDATGFSGEGKVKTPLIDELARQGVPCAAHGHAVVTLPSHASILTGLYPYQHGIRDNAGFLLGKGPPTLAGLLQGAGYATGAFVSAFTLDRRYGLDRGFEVYDDEITGGGPRDFTVAERPGPVTLERALAWWNGAAARPRFLWVHLFEPHYPYEPAPPFASEYARQPYYGEAAAADAALRPLLDPLLEGKARPTLVVLTSDHGEALGDHGEMTHGLFAYEATLKVPLVIWAKGIVAPERIRQGARHIDIVPTVLDLLGIPIPGGLPGKSLFQTAPSHAGSDCYFEALSAFFNRGWAPLFGRLEESRKAIDLPLPELYDLAADPGETRNLMASEEGTHRKLVSVLPARETLLPESGRKRIQDEDLRRLASLGYAAGDAGGVDRAFTAEDDPKNLVEYERKIDEALTSYRGGNHPRAIQLLQEVIAARPRMGVAYLHLSYFLNDQGRVREAVTVLEKALRAGCAGESLRRKLALGQVRLGQAEKAWEVLSADRDSADPDTLAALGRIAATLGRVEEARGFFDRALVMDPTFPTVLADRGILQLGLGDEAAARSNIDQALAQDPGLAEAWNARGVLLARQGHHAEALAAWERALQADPQLSDALFNVALTAGKLGDHRRAEEALRRYIPLAEGEERVRAEDLLTRLREGG